MDSISNDSTLKLSKKRARKVVRVHGASVSDTQIYIDHKSIMHLLPDQQYETGFTQIR